MRARSTFLTLTVAFAQHRSNQLGMHVKRIFGHGCKRPRSTWRACRFLWSDKSGAVALEFAIIAAPLAALMVAILQTSLVFFVQQNLESVAEESARQLITGEVQKAGKSSTDFNNLVCSKLPTFMKCSNVIVDVQTITNFSDADISALTPTFDSKGKPSNTKYLPGGPGSINVLRIMYIWNVGAGPFNFDLSTMSGQRRLLVATAVFKTELYTCDDDAPSCTSITMTDAPKAEGYA